jgi:hypothetical protein
MVGKTIFILFFCRILGFKNMVNFSDILESFEVSKTIQQCLKKFNQ